MGIFKNWLIKRKQKKQREDKRKEELQAAVARRLAVIKEYYTVHMIEIERISPALPDTEEKEDLTPLCSSIRRYGLLEPLSVRRVSEDDSSLGGVFTLIAGKRRYEALKKLGVKKAPCVILDLKAADARKAALSAKFSAKNVSLLQKAELAKSLSENDGAGGTTIGVPEELSTLPCSENLRKAITDCVRLSKDERAVIRGSGMSDKIAADLSAIEDNERRRQAIYGIASSCLNIARSAERERRGGRRMIFNDITPLCNSVDRLVNTLRGSGVPASWSKSVSDERYELKIVVPRRTYRLVNDRSAEYLECIRTGARSTEDRDAR